MKSPSLDYSNPQCFNQFEYQQKQQQVQKTKCKRASLINQTTTTTQSKAINGLAHSAATIHSTNNYKIIQKEQQQKQLNYSRTEKQQQCTTKSLATVFVTVSNITDIAIKLAAALSHFNRNKSILLLLLLFMSCNCRQFGIALEINNNNKEQQQQQQHLQQQEQPQIPTNNNDNPYNGSSDDSIYSSYTNNSNTGSNNNFTSNEPATQTTGVANDAATQYATIDAIEDEDKLPSEIQKAVCTVTAGEVKASAEAVTTKTLKGVCGSAEMNFALSNLEAKLYKEMQEIKLLLQQLLTQQGTNHVATQAITEPATTTTNMPTRQPIGMPAATFKFQPIEETSSEKTNNARASEPADVAANQAKVKPMPQLKSLPAQQRAAHWREQEISKFNNTMLSDRDFKVFTYYWKIENFTERIESGISATVESPIFSIKGKTVRIKAHFQHLHRDFLYLQLEYATLKSGNRNNIILDMGLFKEITNDKINFKHKISILDQNNKRSKDLVSQEFFNLDHGFQVPNSALLGSPYIKENALLIQIFLYL